MLSTLDRYLLREVIQTWVSVTGVLLLIMLTTRFARYLGEAAGGNLPSDAVFALLGLTSIHYLTVLVPVSLFLAVMLALGRLYKDSEMAALMACGVGYGRLLRPLMVLAGVSAVGLALLSMQGSPWAGRASEQVRHTAAREAEAAGFEPGRFRSVGDTVFYADQVGNGGRDLRQVFIQSREPDGRLSVSLAARADQRTDRASGARHLVLYDGRRYSGTPGSAEIQQVQFDEHGVRVALAGGGEEQLRLASSPTLALFTSADPGAGAELQWRISVPLMGVLLVVLAVPLSRTSPRQGRYAKLVAAVLVYVVYSNLLGLSQVWLERAQIPSWVGLWWVHAGIAAFALGLVVSHYGWRYTLHRDAKSVTSDSGSLR